MDDAYDYDDAVFSDRIRWVTRRDRNENHPNYVSLRAPDTRVSLFVRNAPRDDFAYLGELTYRTHRQFTSELDSRVQQEHIFDLKQ